MAKKTNTKTKVFKFPNRMAIRELVHQNLFTKNEYEEMYSELITTQEYWYSAEKIRERVFNKLKLPSNLKSKYWKTETVKSLEHALKNDTFLKNSINVFKQRIYLEISSLLLSMEIYYQESNK